MKLFNRKKQPKETISSARTFSELIKCGVLFKYTKKTECDTILEALRPGESIEIINDSLYKTYSDGLYEIEIDGIEKLCSGMVAIEFLYTNRKNLNAKITEGLKELSEKYNKMEIQ